MSGTSGCDKRINIAAYNFTVDISLSTFLVNLEGNAMYCQSIGNFTVGNISKIPQMNDDSVIAGGRGGGKEVPLGLGPWQGMPSAGQ
jgi:hypothetical protein